MLNLSQWKAFVESGHPQKTLIALSLDFGSRKKFYATGNVNVYKDGTVYSLGQVSVTEGSKTITTVSGATQFLSKAKPGSLFRVNGGNLYSIAAGLSDTSFTLEEPFNETTNGSIEYQIITDATLIQFKPCLGVTGLPETSIDVFTMSSQIGSAKFEIAGTEGLADLLDDGITLTNGTAEVRLITPGLLWEDGLVLIKGSVRDVSWGANYMPFSFSVVESRLSKDVTFPPVLVTNENFPLATGAVGNPYPILYGDYVESPALYVGLFSGYQRFLYAGNVLYDEADSHYINGTLVTADADNAAYDAEGNFYRYFETTLSLNPETDKVTVSGKGQRASAVTDWLEPSQAGTHTSTGEASYWINPSYILVHDTKYTTHQAATAYTDELVISGFNADLPTDAVIIGIEVYIQGAWNDSPAAVNRQYRVGLTKNGLDLAGTRKTDQDLSQSETSYVKGSSSDLWGTTWTPDEINDGGFGVLIADNDTTGALDFHFNTVLVRVSYIAGGTLATDYYQDIGEILSHAINTYSGLSSNEIDQVSIDNIKQLFRDWKAACIFNGGGSTAGMFFDTLQRRVCPQFPIIPVVQNGKYALIGLPLSDPAIVARLTYGRELLQQEGLVTETDILRAYNAFPVQYGYNPRLNEYTKYKKLDRTNSNPLRTSYKKYGQMEAPPMLLPDVQDGASADKLLRFKSLYQSRTFLTVKYQCTLKPSLLTCGDFVEITDDRLGWSGKRFFIVGKTLDRNYPQFTFQESPI